MSEGRDVGYKVGAADGIILRVRVGYAEVETVGSKDGKFVIGMKDGVFEGLGEGLDDGSDVGLLDGILVVGD